MSRPLIVRLALAATLAVALAPTALRLLNWLPLGLTAALVAAVASAAALAWRRPAPRANHAVEALLQAVPEAVVVARKEGAVVRVNARAEALFGCSRQELQARRLEDLLRPAARAGPSKEDSAEVTVTRPVGGPNNLFVVGPAGGRESLVEVTFSPLPSDQGQLVVALVRDVTERRHRERRRAARAAVRRLVCESESLESAAPALLRCLGEKLGWAEAALWADGPDGRRVAARWRSPGAAELAGGESLIDQVWRGNQPAWRGEALTGFGGRLRAPAALCLPVAVGDEVVGVIELLSGESREVDDALLETVGLIGQQAGQLVARARAEQARRQVAERSHQAQKMEAIGQLAAGVAHDFNNLLTVILGSAEMAASCPSISGQAREALAAIEKAAESAAGLTRQLLAYARKQVLMPQPLDLNAVVADLGAVLPRLLGKKIEVATKLACDLGTVRADKNQLEQVLVNLAVNARDAMPGGGLLTIETAAVELDASYTRAHPDLSPGRYVLLAVSDTGCGMDAATRAKLFEPFFTTKEVGKGTGLGLATVYGVVKQSGGHIAVYSEPGRGTSFKIYLPRLAEAEAPAPRPAGPPATAKEATVLVVEDEDRIRELITGLLRTGGYSVLEARHGQEALAVWSQHGAIIDLLVTDLVMPTMGGAELASRLTDDRPDLKVLYVSGYPHGAVAHRALVPADQAYLAKPFTAQALASKVSEVLSA